MERIACGKKTSAEGKDYDPGLGEGDQLSHTYPFDPEPTTPRKPPALLAKRVLERNQLPMTRNSSMANTPSIA
jgi:hypothetical protein